METGIYLRVSTEEQVQEGFSIRAQEQKLKDFTRIKDWSIYRIYTDEGISGKNITERPAMNELIADIQAGHVKNVLVFKIDRLTRNTADLIYLVDLFNDHDCAFNSLMESIDTQTPSGRMFLKIIGIFAEFERENIIERTRLGVERKVREGYCLCTGVASYGYTRTKGDKLQSIHPEEAEVVKDIFDMYISQGLALHGIAKRLNLMKIPSKFGGPWTHTTVRNVLTNCNLVGNVRHHMTDPKRKYEVEGLHEAIISEELFQQAQRLLASNTRHSKTKRPKAENYFSGLLVCALCGKVLETHCAYKTLADGSSSYVGGYRCPGRSVKACTASGMTHANMDIAFQAFIDGIADFDVADEMNLQAQEEHARDSAAQIAAYEDKLLQMDAKEREILNRYCEDVINFENYRRMKEKIDGDRQFIETELERLRALLNTKDATSREDVILALKENWQFLSKQERRQFLVQFVDYIRVVNERSLGKHLGTIRIVDVGFQMN